MGIDAHLPLLWALWGNDDLAHALAVQVNVPIAEVEAYVQGQPSRNAAALQTAMEAALPVSRSFYRGLTQCEVDQYKFLQLIKDSGVHAVRLRGKATPGVRGLLERTLRGGKP